MELTIYQLVKMAIWVIAAYIAYRSYKQKKWKTLGTVCVVAFVAFFISPIRHVEKSGRDLEFTADRFSEVPDKVVEERPTFEDRQKSEYEDLKTQSKEIEK